MLQIVSLRQEFRSVLSYGSELIWQPEHHCLKLHACIYGGLIMVDSM